MYLILTAPLNSDQPHATCHVTDSHMWVVADGLRSAVVLRHIEVVFRKTEEVRVSLLTENVQTQAGRIY